MSRFGDGTVKEEVLLFLEYQFKESGLSFPQFLLTVAEVLASMAGDVSNE